MNEFYIHFPVLSVMGLFLGAFLIEIVGEKIPRLRYGIAFTASLAAAVMTFWLIVPVFIRGEIISYWLGGWKPEGGYAFGIGYEIDGLGLFFGLLVALTFFLSVIFSRRYMERDSHLSHYYTLFLMLAGAVLGLVFTGDVFNLFIMIEIMTFAAVALTTFRHHRQGEALEGAFKYLVLGSIGSSVTLLGIALLYLSTHTLNMAQITALISGGGLQPVTLLSLGLMMAGFGIKAFIVPFHTPAADAYTTAPASISMVFSGMVNKAGVYGVIRLLYTMFRAMDKEALHILLAVMGALTMFVGVTMALAQHDFKRLLAFHSISQIGYVITAVGLGSVSGLFGGLYHALNHTLFKGLLFLTAGAVYYATGTTDLDKLGGLSRRMPRTAICFLFGAFAISGLPPFNGFLSKWLIYQSLYQQASETGSFLYVVVTVIALVVSVMTLASFIKVTGAVFFGQQQKELAQVKEVPLSMQIPMFVMSFLCLAGGILHGPLVSHVLTPAVRAALNPRSYVETMMGTNYAASSQVYPYSTTSPQVGFWNPVLWLLLFIIVSSAVTLVALGSKRSRGKVQEYAGQHPSKYATFFGGEESHHSHVAGSDLFWGFKKDWRGYFKIMGGLHSGRLGDYALWTVAATALLILFVFCFMS